MPRLATPIALGLVAALALAPAVPAADGIGVTAAVNPSATGTPPDGPTRTLLVGTDVVFKERIVTRGEGQTQILFVDESALTVGPDADIVLDEFVYDPSTSTGRMALTVGKGVLRFVGGRITKNTDTVFRTPHATIAIRGSSLGLDTGEQTVAFRTSGRMVCEKDGKVEVVRESGWACVADENGLEVEEVDPEWLRRYFAALHGKSQQGLPEEEMRERIAADCGSGFAVNAQRCGDGDDPLPDPETFEDLADLDEEIEDGQRNEMNDDYYGEYGGCEFGCLVNEY